MVTIYIYNSILYLYSNQELTDTTEFINIFKTYILNGYCFNHTKQNFYGVAFCLVGNSTTSNRISIAVFTDDSELRHNFSINEVSLLDTVTEVADL